MDFKYFQQGFQQFGGLHYIIYPSGTGGEYLSHIISRGLVDGDSMFYYNPTQRMPHDPINGAWATDNLFVTQADIVKGDLDSLINPRFMDHHKHTDLSFQKKFICKEHCQRDSLEFFREHFPKAQYWIVMPEVNDEYWAKVCAKKTSGFIPTSVKGMQKFLNHNFKEFLVDQEMPRNWQHNTDREKINYHAEYYKKFIEHTQTQDGWYFHELYLVIADLFWQGYSERKHEHDLSEYIEQRKEQYTLDRHDLFRYNEMLTNTRVIHSHLYDSVQKIDGIKTYLNRVFGFNLPQDARDDLYSWMYFNDRCQR